MQFFINELNTGYLFLRHNIPNNLIDGCLKLRHENSGRSSAKQKSFIQPIKNVEERGCLHLCCGVAKRLVFF